MLTAADLNAEYDSILNNALSLISPWTGNMAAGGNDLTGLDELAFNDAAANASATRRLRVNGANLTWHDGTAAGRVFYAGGTDVPVADGGIGLSSGTSGGILGFTAAATLASSVALTAGARVLGGGAGATPTPLALGKGIQVLRMNAGATAHEYATLSTGVEAATQAEMEAASSTTVAATAGRTHYHPGVAKAWAKWNDAGTIAASYNTTSIADTGPGDHTWNIGTDFSSADFAAVATGELTSVTLHIRPQAAGTQQILSAGVDTPFSNTDATTWHAAAFGDQA